jgi:hypothetical protein
MQCVRCLKDTAAKVAVAPDGSNAWEVYHCKTCNYSWRNSEPDFITVVEKRDPWGQLDKIKDFQKEIRGIPPYRTAKKNPKTGK